MEWKISYRPDKDIMFVNVNGGCDPTTTVPMIKALLAEAQICNCRKWLIDSRSAVYYYHLLDYYRRPDVYDDLNISADARGAVVFPAVGRKERFYETVCRNRGYDLSVFSDLDAAIGWLTYANCKVTNEAAFLPPSNSQ